jgi:hypothetical protein
MFRIKYGVNKMHCTIFSNKVGWFDGKGVHIHPWALKIKPHNRHCCGQQWYVGQIYPTYIVRPFNVGAYLAT